MATWLSKLQKKSAISSFVIKLLVYNYMALWELDVSLTIQNEYKLEI